MEPAGSGQAAPTGKGLASQALPPGKTIGRYQLVRLLGEGAMGRVYLAHDPELGRDVAIKVLRLETAGSAREAYIARFRNEARAAARFMHPNVVAVYDAGVDATVGPYLVYEYVAGQTLRARLSEGRLEPREVVALARNIAAALDALHAAQILHRDIKPDNILIAFDGGMKLTDFGIARVPDAALTRDGQFLGTPAYAPPEAITRGEYSVRGDVFSLAAVLYEALCGVRPFPGEDAVAVSYAVANETPLPPSRHVTGLPAAVDAVFAKGLAKRAQDRFASAGELAASLHAAFRASGGVATATQPLVKRPQHPPAVSSSSSSGSLRVPLIVVALVLMALVLVLARGQTSSDAARSAVVSANASNLSSSRSPAESRRVTSATHVHVHRPAVQRAAARARRNREVSIEGSH